MLRHSLYDQLYPNSSIPSSELSIHAYPEFRGRVHVFYNATATFRAPSDLSGIGGMRREYIRATPSWRNGHPRYDTVFINSDSSEDGMGGLEVARVLSFHSSHPFHHFALACSLGNPLLLLHSSLLAASCGEIPFKDIITAFSLSIALAISVPLLMEL
jgi:hypothetical protein